MGLSFNERLAAAGRFERDGQLEEAAAGYQKLFDEDAANAAVFGRLLVVYRKLKEYRKELAVINTVIAAFGEREKVAREKWIAKHPKAAGAGRSMLRQLERNGESLPGVNPVVDRLLKRKAVVSKRVGGGKKKGGGVAKRKVAVKRDVVAERKEAAVRKEEAAAERKEAARKKAEEAAERREAAEARKEEMAARKEEAAARKRAAMERKKEEEARKKAALVAKLHPSLFIITLRYLVSLEKIDAAMAQHMAYLDKHYRQGHFLVSGRQVPRTGGIIIARGKDRNAVERIVKEDPFVRKKLASVDIVEFSASQVAKGGRSWLKGL